LRSKRTANWQVDQFESLWRQFAVSVNDQAYIRSWKILLNFLGLSLTEKPEPFDGQEDFGLFSQVCPSFLFGLGAGEDLFPNSMRAPMISQMNLIETG